MSWFNTGPGMEPTHLLDHYPWHTLGKATVVDVGGAYGSVSIALAERFPALVCVVQDRPEVVAEARSRMTQNSTGQVSFMEHDFFTEQPLRDVDVFYLRWILHDWSDTNAIRILRALIPALKPSSRILVSEYIVPEPGTVSPYREKLFRYVNRSCARVEGGGVCLNIVRGWLISLCSSFDISMLEIHNGKERTIGDWTMLLRMADDRFRLLKVRQPALSRLGILEVGWDAGKVVRNDGRG